MSEELKSCPFCGGKPYVIVDNSYGDSLIGCNCYAEPCFTAPIHETAIATLTELWNTRHR